MGAHGGPKVVSDNLRFMMDVADNRCVSPMGTSQWNTAPQAFKNLVDLAQTANVNNNKPNKDPSKRKEPPKTIYGSKKFDGPRKRGLIRRGHIKIFKIDKDYSKDEIIADIER